MKRVVINPYTVGLVFKNGAYQRMLKEGRHWVGLSKRVDVYNMTAPFYPADLNILLQDPELAAMLTVVDVKDNEIVLEYRDGRLNQVLTAGRYAYFRSVVQYDFVRADISKIEITENIDRATLQSKMLAPYVRCFTVEAYEKAVMFVDGNYVATLDGGVYCFWKNSIVINIAKVDTRQLQLEINGQEILTKDKAALRLNAYAQYQVTDVNKALLQNQGYERQLYVQFQFALREYVGTLTLDEVLDKKEALAPFVLQNVSSNAATLGVEVAGFGIRDIILPGDVKEIMNQVLIAEKKAQANIIMRREETASTRSLLNTAKLMEDNQMLFKLKEMEYVEKIADKVNSISVNGNGVLIDQLRQIFVSK